MKEEIRPNIFIEVINEDLSELDIRSDWSNAHAHFLSSLSTEERNDFLTRSRRVTLDANDQLFRAGDRSDNVYVVTSGCIRLLQLSETGKETILWFNFPGEIFGIAESWSGNQRQIYAVADQATEVLSIDRMAFVDFLGTHPEAAMKAIGILSARFRSLGQSLVGLASDNVEKRIGRLLLRFALISSSAHRCDHIMPNELCVNVRLRHQDIANMIGASRPTVSTTLANLRKNGSLRIVDHHLHILGSSDYQKRGLKTPISPLV